jgi:hypothetical protein
VVARLTALPGVARLAARLCEVGLWERTANGYAVHDYLDYQPSAAEVRAERAMSVTRKRLYDDPFLIQKIRFRDGDGCRYCDLTVRWNDRKGPGGGTYDHADPRGGNSLDNVVVACRGCNSRKGQRTPEAAGMPLLPPRGRADNGQIPGESRADNGQINLVTDLPTSRTHPGPVDPAPPTPPRGGGK